MRRARGITVQPTFVIGGKAYFTVRTATQAVARQIADNILWRYYNRPMTQRRDKGSRQKQFWQTLQSRLYNRVKPIVVKVFKDNGIPKARSEQ